MATLARRLLAKNETEQRHSIETIDDYFTYLGNAYPLGLNTTWKASNEEAAPNDFESYALQMFAADPVVFAAVVTRLAVFSQARLQYRLFRDGRPQELFGDRSLRVFERPWPGGTTSDLLGKMLLRTDLAGNGYVWNSGKRLHVWRPDWVTIILGSELEPDDPASAEDATVVGLMYTPGGSSSKKSRLYLPDEVAHFAPLPDPLAQYRGMSWLTPIIREVQADKAATEHKWRFFQNGATPNLVIKYDKAVTAEKLKAFKELMADEHQGYLNAYKTLHLGGGADATVVGADFQQMDFSATQGKGETRIAMASGVHPVILGASEGLQGSSLNAGNYGQAKRLLADVRLQHLWGNAAASLEVLVPAREDGAELWFDARHIPFLQDDLKDTAEIQAKQAQAIGALVKDGFTAASVVQAIEADDFSLLEHTGLFSVQLQPPGAGDGMNAVSFTDPELVARKLAEGWTVYRPPTEED